MKEVAAGGEEELFPLTYSRAPNKHILFYDGLYIQLNLCLGKFRDKVQYINSGQIYSCASKK